jgi:hypothetical protein
LDADILDFDDEKVVENDTNLEAPVEEEFEKDLSQEVHGDIVPPLWREPFVKVVNKY